MPLAPLAFLQIYLDFVGGALWLLRRILPSCVVKGESE